ncbi:MAG: aldehyde dehydrogenase family protein [Calditrichaeota bacterium]|nr:aldehyde dehydrogenase family protein [Calditrichota bacterium]
METKTESRNPITGEVLGQVPLNTIDDVREAIRKGREAQKIWAGISVKERAKRLLPIRDYMVEHAEELAEIISRDNGKVRLDALIADVLTGPLILSYYCKHAPKILADETLWPGSIVWFHKISKLVRVPFGVVGIISPWNYPFTIPFHEVIIALLAGNAVLLKMATQTQMVGMAFKKTIESADLPEGVFQYINLPGRLVGDAFLENGIDKLCFTGSVPVGKKLMAKAAETLTPVSLELGGNDPALICADADPYRAAMGVLWAGFSNAGQTCGGIERVYVHEEIYDAFLAILKEKVDHLRVGYDTDFNVDMGGMTTESQIEVIQFHLEDALKKGARIAAESKVNNPGSYKNLIPARVLVDVNHEMRLMQEESFGPIVGVMKVRSEEEAVRLANDSNMGLSASVWSKNLKKAERLARQIQAGAVLINDHLMSHAMAETPWGGFKESGIGRTHSQFFFYEVTEPQVIVKDWLSFAKRDMWWHPYSKPLYDRILGTLHFLYGKGIRKRTNGLLKMLPLIWRMFTKNGKK